MLMGFQEPLMNKSGGFNFLPGLFFLKQGSQRTSLKMTGTDFIFSEFKCGQRSCLHILKKNGLTCI